MQQRSLTSHWPNDLGVIDVMGPEADAQLVEAQLAMVTEAPALGAPAPPSPAPSPAASDPGPPLRVTTRGGSAALVASCLDQYSNTVANFETWNELKQVAAKNLRGEEPEPEPDWEEDEPVYDGLQARGRDMEKVMDDQVASDQRQALKRAVGEGSAPAAKAARNN